MANTLNLFRDGAVGFIVPLRFRSDHTNRADLQQCLQRVRGPTMFHDSTTDDPIHVDCIDFYAFACRLLCAGTELHDYQ